ncbi:GGDEF domain-containing protein [Qipengyuania sp. ASV99]|uniref:GGDEF domain-containing protein n=1 Tax=Qipengyuania sp. ASV99 TaxID=3399681 RepID=UPI003A4C8481
MPTDFRFDPVVVTKPGAIGMEMGFSIAEGRALRGLLEDASGDIVVRLDPGGFVVHASPNVAELGIDLTARLFMPHITDFAEPGHGAEVARFVDQVFAGTAHSGRIEFPVRICAVDDCTDHDDPENPAGSGLCRRWYTLGLKLVENGGGDAGHRALGLLRLVRHAQVSAADNTPNAMIDPVTGLASRQVFFASLHRAFAHDGPQTVALLAVDSLKALALQYGRRTADEIQWGFARFLESMVLPGHELAQLDGERCGVLLHGMTLKQARCWSEDVLQTFGALAVSASKRAPELTASAGLAQVEASADWTMRQAELGLVMARAGGGGQTGVCGHPLPL